MGESSVNSGRYSVSDDSDTAGRSGLPLPPATFFGFIVAVVAIVLIALLGYNAHTTRARAADSVTHSLELIEKLQTLFSTLQDAETGQRGFLLTGRESYLEPFTNSRAAVPGQMAVLRSYIADNASQLQQVDTIERLATEKLDELQETIDLRRQGKLDEAQAVVLSDRGKGTMDRVRALLGDMQTAEHESFLGRQRDWQRAVTLSSWVTWGGSLVLLLFILSTGYMTSRDYRQRRDEEWIRRGQMGLANRVQGEQRLEVLGGNVLDFLAGYLDAPVGAIYITEERGRFRRVAGYALDPAAGAEVLTTGDGLLGEAAKAGQPLHVRNVPAAYLPVNSSLGRADARELLLAPATVDGVVHAVLELGFFRPVQAIDRELLARASGLLAVAVRASRDRSRLEELLEETQQQSEELQTQEEELRASNEELEVQALAMKESQARLEAQQTELEENNAQLEEQTQQLERQTDALTGAQGALTARAEELQRANQYKSEFLANMSHELRTPLNSSLILAKLLADNKHGNLSGEQVRFAQTIHAAGNDLLVLINDILDLAKIESGKVDLDPQPVLIAATLDALHKTMLPLARQKNIAFAIQVDAGAPERFETDPQRLGQILKNLLSNALKFTEKGEVTLRAFAADADTLSFEVRDTGIGIAQHQQQIIFEAFRQADGSTHRKYGGTGLGLSISRDLARLLGGDIEVRSKPGEGSVFKLTLPRVLTAPDPAAIAAAQSSAVRAPPPAPAPESRASRSQPTATQALAAAIIEDDRDHLGMEERRILVVEDDVRFAAILRDLAHELNFQCVITHSANDGLAAATRYRPSAILLDMNLPDHSGLGVLDQLKRNPATRHIPVHVISVADYSQEALELGAIGYALKPVKREQLVEAFQKFEAKLAQGIKRLLIVEDDARQSESLQQLLANGDVQITPVLTAADALRELRTTTFDCVVMDLNLPDLSGYELLEKMAAQEDVSFPPVIVYTGRSLSRDEEQSLRRFSRSIIIKDARSPERLLDEVTLFLHQVESTLPVERQRMLKQVRDRETTFEGRRILVVEDDARNIFALSSVLEPKGAKVEIARNGREALEVLERSQAPGGNAIDLVLMDIMMPEMDGFTAMREIRKRPEWKGLPIIALTAKAMKDDQEKCLAAGANDYIAKPLDVEKLLSLTRVWMPK